MKKLLAFLLACSVLLTIVACGNSPTNTPSEERVIECLEKVPGILEIAAVTEENDPNGLLNKAGSYVACVYFSYVLVDEDELYGDDLIDCGTNAGGCIEVYKNKEDARKRNDYLETFDGGVLSSGSHTVVGTVVVRTSNLLTANQQRFLEANIIAALKGERVEQLNSNYNEKSDAEWTVYTKDLAEQEYYSKHETLIDLVILGCSLEKAKQYTESCGVNWNEMAKCRVEFLELMYDAISPFDAASILASLRFTQEQIEYALMYSQIDWQRSALVYAGEYSLNFDEDECITPEMLKYELEDCHDFSSALVDYAIENCNIDWEKMALLAISEYADSSADNQICFGFCIKHGVFEDVEEKFRCVVCGEETDGAIVAYIFTRDDVREMLIRNGFDNGDIDSAIDACDTGDLWGWFSYIDYPEYWLADFCLGEWLDEINKKPTRSEAKEKLREYGFDATVCEYTVDQCDGWYFQD